MDNTVTKSESDRSEAQLLKHRRLEPAETVLSELTAGPMFQEGLRHLRNLDAVEKSRPLPEDLGAAVELRKGDGAVLTLRDGLVCGIKNGSNCLSIDYEKQDGKVVFDENGQAKVAKVRALVGGNECEIDAALLRSEGQLSALTVVQRGDGLGSVVLKTGDGKTSTLRSDFCRVEHEQVALTDGRTVERVSALHRPNGSQVIYNYDRNQPLKLQQVVERYRTSLGKVVTQYTDRVGESEKFVTHTQVEGEGKDGGQNIRENLKPTWRTDLQMAQDGELAYKELNEKFFMGPRNEGDGAARDLQAAREEFLRVASANKVFQGNENTILGWMNGFERRVDGFSRRGWMAPSDLDLADSYSNLSRIFTDSVSGRASVVGAQERRLLVESALKELADPKRYINQGSIGTCSLNSVESNLAGRRPQELTRWLREACTKGYVTSRGVNTRGERVKVHLSEAQLNYEPSWNRSYSNQIFQFASIAALGYRSRGYDYGGTTNDQLNYVSRLACGQNMRILDNWMGRGARKADIVDALKNRGSVAYIVPGHCMAIDDYDPKTDRFYVNNWWGGSRDGWYSARGLGLR